MLEKQQEIVIVGTPDKATTASQTNDMVDTTNQKVISCSSSSTDGLTAPSILAVHAIDIDSDSSVKIAHNCFLTGEMGESNSESAARPTAIRMDISKKKKRRNKRRRKLELLLRMLLERQLKEDSYIPYLYG